MSEAARIGFERPLVELRIYRTGKSEPIETITIGHGITTNDAWEQLNELQREFGDEAITYEAIR